MDGTDRLLVILGLIPLLLIGLLIVYYLYLQFYSLYCKFVSEPRQKKFEQELAEREQELAKRKWEAGSKDRELARELAREQAIKDFSLNCEDCGALAAPIPSTNNRYRCNKCGRQFASSPHPI